MGKVEYRRAEKPTYYFIGVTTGSSSIMRVFPEWARHLKLGDCRLEGIDFPPHDEPQTYREAVQFIKQDPLSLGALVTTHKIDLLAACRDLFDELDPYARLTGEVSCISKHGENFGAMPRTRSRAACPWKAFCRAATGNVPAPRPS